MKSGVARSDGAAFALTAPPSPVAFPAPRIPSAPVLSFGAPFGRQGLVVPSLLDLGATLRLTSGRAALAAALKLLGVGPGQSVLLPAYNCPSIIDAVAWVGARPVLYRSGPDLAPELNDLAAKIAPDTRCLLVIHYFGFPQDLRTLREFADAHGIALVEDCAHCFFGRFDGQPVGSFGDYAIASPMKFFPIYDGGLLASSRRPVIGLRPRSGGAGFQIKSLLSSLERAFAYSRLKPFNWLLAPLLSLKDRVWTWAKRQRGSRGAVGPHASSSAYDFDPDWADVAMSVASRALMRCTSVGRLVARRRKNYETMLAAFAGHPRCRPLRTSLPPDVVPYVFPLVVDNAERSFSRLKMQGVPLFRWEDVDDTVCEASAYYSRHLFQLPCHQELTAADLDWLIAEVKLAVEL